MHNNYYFLKVLSKTLQKQLWGFEIVSCFSQSKDELVIGLVKDAQELYIKATLTASFAALSFPEQFHRAKANSVNLFKEMIGEKVCGIVQHENERSFVVQLSGRKSLLFKMFGNRSNILLFEDEIPIANFHKKFEKDLSLQPQEMGRNLATDFDTFLQKEGKIQQLYPTFGDLPQKYLAAKGYEKATINEKWELQQQVLQELNEPVFYLTDDAGKLRLSLLPFGEIRAEYTDPIEALNQFVRTYLSEHAFSSLYRQTSQTVERSLHVAETIAAQATEKLNELEHSRSYSQTANLIMANLTNIPKGAEEVELFDFYSNQNRIIPLKKGETPQKTAERLYKKAKNQQIEVKLLKQKIETREAEIFHLLELQEKLAEIKDLKKLRQFVKDNDLETSRKAAQNETLFREFSYLGFKILVGKSAKNNDVLTQKHAHKDDLWLHAKDVSGSHVVVKQQSGKTIPETVLEKAAQLAAYYSKRKTDSLCPVMYTPKKYVRKPKGAPAGAVFVEREKVILVEPQNPFERQF